MADKEKSLSEREVINLLKGKKKPVSFMQIAKALGIDKKERKRLKKLLKSLKKSGKVRVVRGKRR